MQVIKKRFLESFTETRLKEIFVEHVSLSGATGIDNTGAYAFREILDSQVEVISRKVGNGTYRFTKYKLKLISKGAGKAPREISIPTVRDRIALRALCDFLIEAYSGIIAYPLPQNLIREVKAIAHSGKYDSYIKLDVSNFYPSIKHDELLKRLRGRIRRSPEIIDFISLAIKSPTVVVSSASDKQAVVGVPQGLAISNILAAIYLVNIDKFLNAYANALCYRYVDDILIFCNSKDVELVTKDILRRFNKIGLEIHPLNGVGKSSSGIVSSRFDYLGYQFEDGVVSARPGSVDKLKESLVSIFTSYRHSKIKSKEFLLWRLNLRITGCVFQGKSKGWVFFFSEITDEALLHKLDHYVMSLAKRFDVDIKPKKFVRAFHEISHRKHETNYVPNFDSYDLSMKRNVLVEFFGKNVAGMLDEEIEHEFMKKITKQVKNLLEDIQAFGY